MTVATEDLIIRFLLAYCEYSVKKFTENSQKDIVSVKFDISFFLCLTCENDLNSDPKAICLTTLKQCLTNL